MCMSRKIVACKNGLIFLYDFNFFVLFLRNEKQKQKKNRKKLKKNLNKNIKLIYINVL